MSDRSVGVPPASSSSNKSGQDGHAPARAPFYNPDAETLTSRHNLPHWNQDHCQCMVTWRLDDAMPADLLATWKSERELWQNAHPQPWDEITENKYHRRFSKRIDEWLDAGHGECLLRRPETRKIVADSVEHFDGSRYQLTSYVIMPNHVHVLLSLKAEHPLAEVLHSWKSFTAKAINKALNRKGTLWQPEYWDRLIRSQRHLEASLAYVQDNPAKAKLPEGSYTHWSVGVSPASSSAHKSGQDGHAPGHAPFLIYQSENGRTKLDVRLEGETVWLSQKQLTELFGKAKGTISEHIKHIFEDGELGEDSVVRLFRTTAADGKSYDVTHYNLDMVLALGFRVRSTTAVRFRQWAADKLKEFIRKGFVLDDDRLKNPQAGNDYFEELTRRIQDIRTSERRFYQKITDIYATSIDYDKDAPLTQSFFATVQNKVHFAIHGQTAAEVIVSRADQKRPNMGLTNWEGARIRKTDVAIAKNYLNEEELRALNNLVEQYLIFAQSQAERRVPMTMRDWITKLEGFLALNDRAIEQLPPPREKS